MPPPGHFAGELPCTTIEQFRANGAPEWLCGTDRDRHFQRILPRTHPAKDASCQGRILPIPKFPPSIKPHAHAFHEQLHNGGLPNAPFTEEDKAVAEKIVAALYAVFAGMKPAVATILRNSGAMTPTDCAGVDPRVTMTTEPKSGTVKHPTSSSTNSLTNSGIDRAASSNTRSSTRSAASSPTSSGSLCVPMSLSNNLTSSDTGRPTSSGALCIPMSSTISSTSSDTFRLTSSETNSLTGSHAGSPISRWAVLCPVSWGNGLTGSDTHSRASSATDGTASAVALGWTNSRVSSTTGSQLSG
ncbi:hypothetical protein K461DRAFT_265647 [Myriangium duriaei CBS 260.36]|uniref:Uncharacterized protein n=1 Tax=Myriangium duriaei CBS 260.36 TaxID=1168546 RepID=A0A9P4JC10_9PEZI|nr:hypothetical protein K461DRAFT_265647 [Myriangium duriaei CBS 260.36]